MTEAFNIDQATSVLFSTLGLGPTERELLGALFQCVTWEEEALCGYFEDIGSDASTGLACDEDATPGDALLAWLNLGKRGFVERIGDSNRFLIHHERLMFRVITEAKPIKKPVLTVMK